MKERTSSSSVQRISTAAGSEERTSCHKQPASFCRSFLAGVKVSRSSYVTWIWCAILFCSCIPPCLSQESAVTEPFPTTAAGATAGTTAAETTSPPPTPQAFKIVDCINSFDSSDQRRYICINNQELFPILKYAEQVGKATCEEEFQHEHWNCSGFSLLQQPNITKGDDIYKESAYVYSVSLAVITHTVAKGCAAEIINCSCPEKEGGCPDPVTYGLHIAQTFLNKRYTSQGGGLKQELVLHNFRAAEAIIRSVMNSTFKKCRCHGISGSCTFSVCSSELPSFSTLAKKVRQAYNDSCEVKPNGHSRNEWAVSECDHTITETDLLFTKRNTWCQYDPEIGSAGVVGRECSPHPNAPNSCNKLCGGCKRPSQQQSVEEEFQCDCQFKFCCEIKCDTCMEQRTYFTCS